MRSIIMSAVMVLVCADSARAQEKPLPPSEPAQEKEGMKDKDTAPREEHVIYVPYKNLKDIFEKEESSVLLPYAQFLQMWGQMIGPIVPPVKPPVAGVITRADYTGAVEDELVRLRATLAV